MSNTTTTTSSTTSSFKVPEKIISNDVQSQSISNWTEIITYCRSRNVNINATRLKPLTKHYAFFDGVSVDRYMTSKFISINMISGIFQVGELVESDPLFTSGRFSFRLCTPNHYEGPYNNPTKTYNKNIISFPLAETYGLTAQNYSPSSPSLNIDLNSLENPSDVTFTGYARPGMRLIGRVSGAIAEVVESILVTDESGFLNASFFIPDPSVMGNPKFINGTNNIVLIDRPTLSDDGFLSFVDANYYSSGTTNVTDVNNITTRNYTIIPAKTINTTTITNTTSNIVTNTVSVSAPQPPRPSSSSSSSSSAPTVKRYEGIASGYIPSTNSSGTVNQNAGGFAPDLGTNRTSNSIGAAAVARAIQDGYSIKGPGGVQEWVNRTNAIVGPEARAKYGITGGRFP